MLLFIQLNKYFKNLIQFCTRYRGLCPRGVGGVLTVYMTGGRTHFLELKIYIRGIFWVKRSVTYFVRS